MKVVYYFLLKSVSFVLRVLWGRGSGSSRPRYGARDRDGSRWGVSNVSRLNLFFIGWPKGLVIVTFFYFQKTSLQMLRRKLVFISRNVRTGFLRTMGHWKVCEYPPVLVCVWELPLQQLKVGGGSSQKISEHFLSVPASKKKKCNFSILS